jgi:hypothetical protein
MKYLFAKWNIKQALLNKKTNYSKKRGLAFQIPFVIFTVW